MGLFSLNPKSAEAVEPYLQLFDERPNDFYAMNGYLGSQAKPAVLGQFEAFGAIRKHFLLQRNIHNQDRRVSRGTWGEVGFTGSHEFARVELPVAPRLLRREFVESFVPRVVDMRDFSTEVVDEAGLCTRAITKAVYEYAADLPEPLADVTGSIIAAEAQHRESWTGVDRYVEEIIRLASD